MSSVIYWDTFRQKFKRPKKPVFPAGSRVYKGYQGQGKTLSMVAYAFYIQKLCPNALIYSNILINGLNNYHYFNDNNGLTEALSVSNGLDGVLVLLDEAHLFFNKKDGISIDVLTAISQQRKDLRRIVFSSQIWEELDISLRKQVKEIVSCKCFLGFIQFNQVSDGETLTYDKLKSEYVANKIGYEIFKHNNKLYEAYNTRQKIVNNMEYKRELSGSPPPVGAAQLSITTTKRKVIFK